MKNGLTLLAALSAVFAQAQIAYDSAEESVYIVGQEYIQVGTPPGDQTSATNGLNGGYGWNRWQRGGYGDNGNYGNTLITAINASFNMGSKQFGIRSGLNGADFSGADARRRLLNPLAVGSTMSWSMMAGGNGAGQQNTIGEFGAEIRSGLLSNPGRDMLIVIGEYGQNWRVFRLGGSVFTTLPVTPGQRMDVHFVSKPGDQFDITFTPFGGTGQTISGSYLSTGQLPQTLQFYAFGSNGDNYFNYIRADEPSAQFSGTLNLSDTVFGGSYTRTITGTVKQGAATIGTITVSGINSGSTAFTGSVPSSATGAATIEWDGSSFLLRKTNITLTGSNLAIGTVTMQNGDVDASGEVDAADIDEVIANFGSGANINSDVDVSGEVDAADIDIVIANFGGTDD